MQDKLQQILLVLLFFIPLSLWGQNNAEELVEQELSWEDVEGAWGYEVVIRSGTEEIIRQQMEQSEFTFSLNPGEYEFSIVVLNKFKKTVSMTPWKPLIIKEAFQPVVRRFSPEEVFESSSGTLTLLAEVYQVQGETSFYLTDQEGRRITGRQRELNQESVELEFPMNQLSPGVYTLSAVDSSGLSDTSDVTILTVREVIEPEIRSVNNRRLEQKQVYPDIIVKGRGFEEGLTARITYEDQLLVPFEIEWLTEDEVRLGLITGMVTPGRYDLELINPSGVSAEKERAFIIEKAPLTEIIEEVPPQDTLSLLGGYTIAANTSMTEESSDYGDFDTVPFGLGLKLRQDIANKYFWRIPGLRPLGLEIGIDYIPTHYSTADFYYNQLYAGFHFYYKVVLLRDWALMPRLGGGISNLWVTDGSVGGETIQGELGYGITFALGVQKEFKSGVLLEFGFDIRHSGYSGGDLDSLNPWIMGGYRL